MISSKIELHSYVQMIVSQLPFPPLPIVAIAGEDNEQSVASSHDMLHSAISCQVMKQIQNISILDNSTQKSKILHNLFHDVVKIYRDENFQKCPDTMIANLYETYTKAMREYLCLYMGINSSICFWPIEKVCSGDLLVKQGQSHLKAYNSCMQGPNCIHAASNSYPDLLLSYAKTMSSMEN